MNHICIVTALPAESRVFIDALRLKPILDHGWRLYGNSEYLLLQTGLGKLKAAAAVSALLHTRHDIRAIINVGIAGGITQIGDTFLAHQIIDQGSGDNWYPHLPSLMESTVPIVDSISNWFSNTLNIQSPNFGTLALHENIVAAFHHTATEKHQLLRLLQQHYALTGELPAASQLLQTKNASQLIQSLRSINADIPLTYGNAS